MMNSSAFVVAFAILSLLLPFVADIAAGGDVWQIAQQNEVSHRWGGRLRALFLALPCLTLTIPLLVIPHHSSFWQINGALGLLLLKTVILWLILCTEFWIVFDLRINARWGKKWYYIGATAALDTFWGKFLNHFEYPGKVYLVIKCLIYVALLAMFGALVF